MTVSSSTASAPGILSRRLCVLVARGILLGSPRLPAKLRQLAERASHAFAPLPAQRGEIRIPLVEPAAHPSRETVSFIANQIDRHTRTSCCASSNRTKPAHISPHRRG